MNPPASTLSPAEPTSPAAGITDRLAAELTGRLASPADPDWDQVRRAWNLAVDQRPDFVVQAADAADVIAVVRFAAGQGLRVAPQGTGHNAAALGDLAGTILLRTDRMRELVVDPADRIVRAGAGVRWGEVTAALAPYGLTALAGSSPDVGVVGYTLGGGFSWLARRHGLACSAVTAAELVTGDGVFHRVDPWHEPELFWAVRGGGGNIGVVCALEFEVQPLKFIYAGALMFPLHRSLEVLQAYRRWTSDLEDTVTSCVRVLRLPPLPELPEFLRGQSFVVVDGAIEAPISEAARLLAPLREIGPAIDTFGCMPTAELGALHMDPPAPVPAAGDGMVLRELTDEAIEALLAVVGPDRECALLAVDVRHLGGAIGRPDRRGGVVDHLPGAYLLYAVGMAAFPQAAAAVLRDVQAVRDALAPWASDRDDANFRETAAAPSRLHAPADLERLRALRQQHDPQTVIRSNHPLG